MNITDSVLTSIKKLLGIAEEYEHFEMCIRDRNKIYGIIFIILGALTIPIEWDATFFLFALMVGIMLFACLLYTSRCV